MNDETGISVVIPTYNRADRLPAALDSVLEQDWPCLELVVVDDGSTDDTPMLLEEYRRRHPGSIRVVRQENQGPPAARNAGIMMATFPYIAFLDSDDAWRPQKLREQMRVLGQAEELEFCFTAVLATRDAEQDEWILNEWDVDPAKALHRLLIGPVVTLSSVLMTKRLLMMVGLFDSSLRAGAEDYDLWLRVAAAGSRMAYCPLPLTIYVAHAGGKSQSLRVASDNLERILLLQFSDNRLPASFARRRRRYVALRYLNNAVNYLQVGENRRAARSLLKAAVTRPLAIRPGWFAILARAISGMTRRRARPSGTIAGSS